MKQNKQFFHRLLAVAFWLAVWQAAAMAIGQEVFLVSPVQALRTFFNAIAAGRFLAAGGLQLRAHFAGFCAGRSGQRGAGGVRRPVERRRCTAGSGDAAGQGHAGGKLYHSGAGLGAGAVRFRCSSGF